MCTHATVYRSLSLSLSLCTAYTGSSESCARPGIFYRSKHDDGVQGHTLRTGLRCVHGGQLDGEGRGAKSAGDQGWQPIGTGNAPDEAGGRRRGSHVGADGAEREDEPEPACDARESSERDFPNEGRRRGTPLARWRCSRSQSGGGEAPGGGSRCSLSAAEGHRRGW